MSIFPFMILPLLTISVLSFIYTTIVVIRSGKDAGALAKLGLGLGGIFIGTSVELHVSIALAPSLSSNLISVGYILLIIGIVYMNILVAKSRK
jgi:hypothetical protein